MDESKPWNTGPSEYIDNEATPRIAAFRHPELRTWCGYVEVPEGHPWHGRHLDYLGHVNVHGGITFAGDIVEPMIEGSSGWWIGFDCAHAGDYMPSLDSTLKSAFPDRGRSALIGWEYRTLEYVRAECARLAEQVREAAL